MLAARSGRGFNWWMFEAPSFFPDTIPCGQSLMPIPHARTPAAVELVRARLVDDFIEVPRRIQAALDSDNPNAVMYSLTDLCASLARRLAALEGTNPADRLDEALWAAETHHDGHPTPPARPPKFETEIGDAQR